MAAELESMLDESADLIQSSGGVFEVEYKGQLLFSKKELSRFPEDQEILHIVKNLQDGMPLDQAKAEAGANARRPPSFNEWLSKLWHKKAQ